MKKMITLCLTLVMLILCFTGCGGSKDHKDTQTQAQVQKPATEEQKPVADGINVIDVFAGLNLEECIPDDDQWDNKLDGSGMFWSHDLNILTNNVDYDKSNSDVKEFLKDIDVYWVEHDEMQYKLRNGDVITLGLEYSKSEAEALGITVLEETKQYTVDWLIEVYRDSVELDLAKLQEMAKNMIDRRLSEDDVTYFSSGEADWVENYTHTADARVFCEYGHDGNGERYIRYVLVMVKVQMEYDAETDVETEDGMVYEHHSEEKKTLYLIPVAKAEGADEKIAFGIESIDLEEDWYGEEVTYTFGGGYQELNGTLVELDYDDETGTRVIDTETVIEELTIN